MVHRPRLGKSMSQHNEPNNDPNEELQDELNEELQDEPDEELQDEPGEGAQSLHVIARHGRGISRLASGLFESRAWRLSAARATVERTGYFFAHENSQTLSYRAGRIVRFEYDPVRRRWVVIFELLNLDMPWPNGVAHGGSFAYGPAPADQAAAPPALPVATEPTVAPDLVAVPESAPAPPIPAPPRDLYVAENSRLPGSYMVGSSDNVAQSMAELERFQNFHMRAVVIFPGRADVERAVHQALQPYPDRGGPGTEWFQVPLWIILGAITFAIGAA